MSIKKPGSFALTFAALAALGAAVVVAAVGRNMAAKAASAEA